jgi:hypothetical protein
VTISEREKNDIDQLRLVPEDDTRFINMWLHIVFSDETLLVSSVSGASRIAGERLERLDPPMLEFIKRKF